MKKVKVGGSQRKANDFNNFTPFHHTGKRLGISHLNYLHIYSIFHYNIHFSSLNKHTLNTLLQFPLFQICKHLKSLTKTCSPLFTLGSTFPFLRSMIRKKGAKTRKIRENRIQKLYFRTMRSTAKTILVAY